MLLKNKLIFKLPTLFVEVSAVSLREVLGHVDLAGVWILHSVPKQLDF